MARDDDYEPERSPADPPFVGEGAGGRAKPEWWRQLDVVRVASLVLGLAALILLAVIAIQHLVG